MSHHEQKSSVLLYLAIIHWSLHNPVITSSSGHLTDLSLLNFVGAQSTALLGNVRRANCSPYWGVIDSCAANNFHSYEVRSIEHYQYSYRLMKCMPKMHASPVHITFNVCMHRDRIIRYSYCVLPSVAQCNIQHQQY